MGQLSLTLLRLGFLVLLWALVLGAVAVLRADIYGTRVIPRGRGLTRLVRTAVPQTGAVLPRSSTGVLTTRTKAGAVRRSIVVVEGPLTGTSIPLGDAPVTIGRSPTSTLVIDDDYCSARHARIYHDGGRWWVEDLASTNGTFVGDARLYDPIELVPGTRVRMGATEIESRDS